MSAGAWQYAAPVQAATARPVDCTGYFVSETPIWSIPTYTGPETGYADDGDFFNIIISGIFSDGEYWAEVNDLTFGETGYVPESVLGTISC